MLTVQELAALAARHDGVRTLSAYIGLPPASPPGVARTLLRQGIARLREGLSVATHVERTAFDACCDRLLARVDSVQAPAAGATWVGIASADGATYDEWLPAVVPTTFAWEERLRVAPYLAAIVRHGALVTVADRQHAALFRYENDALAAVDQWETRPSIAAGEHTGHMSALPRVGFHRGTGGLPGADAADRQSDNAVERHLSGLIDRISSLRRGGDWLVLSGASEFVARLASALERDTNGNMAVGGSLTRAATPADVRSMAAAAVASLRTAEGERIVEEVVRQPAAPRTALGAESVSAALGQGAVRLLVLSQRSLGDQSASVEDLVRRALATGAEVEFVNGDAGGKLQTAAGGVAALLRFTPAQGREGES